MAFNAYHQQPGRAPVKWGRGGYKTLTEARQALVRDVTDTVKATAHGEDISPLAKAAAIARAKRAEPGERIKVGSLDHWIEEV